MNITSPCFDDQELALVQKCLASHWVTQGPLTQEFESLFRARHKVENAIATTSCTAALHLSATALDLKAGDEVIVPAFTWVTSAHCAEYMGAKVVFADISLETFNIDPQALEAAITPYTKAIVVVHLFGLAAPMTEIVAIARKHNLHIIEDAACAVGTEYDGQPVGSFGDLGCFSFHPRKVITTGEGGMVTTNSESLAERVKIFRNHGASGYADAEKADPKPYSMGRFEHLGFNLRLSDIQAAIGIAQMSKLNDLLLERKQRAEQYNDLLKNVNELALPTTPEKCGHTYQSYVVRFLSGGRESRNRAMEKMAADNIQTRPGTHAVHRLGYYQSKYNIQPSQFPNAADAEDLTITLPIFPGMTDADQKKVAQSLMAGLTS